MPAGTFTTPSPSTRSHCSARPTRWRACACWWTARNASPNSTPTASWWRRRPVRPPTISRPKGRSSRSGRPCSPSRRSVRSGHGAGAARCCRTPPSSASRRSNLTSARSLQWPITTRSASCALLTSAWSTRSPCACCSIRGIISMSGFCASSSGCEAGWTLPIPENERETGGWRRSGLRHRARRVHQHLPEGSRALRRAALAAVALTPAQTVFSLEILRREEPASRSPRLSSSGALSRRFGISAAPRRNADNAVIDLTHARNLMCDLLGPPAQCPARGHPGQRDPPIDGGNRNTGRRNADADLLGQRRIDLDLQKLIGKLRTGRDAIAEAGVFGKLAYRIHTGLDRQTVGVEHDVVKKRVLLLDVERRPQGAGAGGVKALQLMTHRLGILGAEPLHHDADAEIHRRAHAHADDVRQVAQQRRRAPTANENAALLGNAQDFLGRVLAKLAFIDGQSFEQEGRAFQIAEHRALRHPEAPGNRVCNDLRMNDLQSQPVSDPLCHVGSEAAELPGHCDDGHVGPHGLFNFKFCNHRLYKFYINTIS